MSDILDEDGLSTKSLSDLIDDLTADLKNIFGDDINVDSDSPDGEIINIFSQAARDLREVLEDVYNSFDPEQASGRVLDQRVAINGIERNGGTYTQQPVEITVDKDVSLVGLDDESETLEPDISNLYTIKDDAGTQFYLLESVDLTEGTTELYFRAAEIGAVETTINTITTAVTVIDGVADINNPSAALTVGEDEETDAELKKRRRTSQALSSIGNVNGLQAALADIDGVSVAIVTENDTNEEDENGVPAHSIWCVVIGGEDEDIAETIASKKTHGCGTYGEEEVTLEYTDGREFTIKFDRGVQEDLYASLSIALPNDGVIDKDNIADLIAENVSWGVGDDASTTAIIGYLYSLNSEYIVTGCGISKTEGSYIETVSPSAVNNQLVLSADRITVS